jgi:hypothetical protein
VLRHLTAVLWIALKIIDFLRVKDGSVSKSLSAINNPEIRVEVTRLFTSPPFPTMAEVARATKQTHQTVSAIVRETVPPDQLRILKVGNYSKSKMGVNNPMFGARKQVEAILREGYLYLWVGDNTYVAEHRLILMKSLGLKEWPEGWEVHHIDSDKMNNSLDNLAIVTTNGHRQLHKQKLQKLYVWEKREFGTSQLKEMLATLRKG